MTTFADDAVKNVVLVHGAFADGSGWKPVASIWNTMDTVFVVQEPLTAFEADVVITRIVLDGAGPCVLVGHSWAGMIITEVGMDASCGAWFTSMPSAHHRRNRLARCREENPTRDSEHWSRGRWVRGRQAGSVSPGLRCRLAGVGSHFMSISQVPIAASSFDATVKATAWSQKPSYAVVSTGDRMINPELERFMKSPGEV